DQVCVELREQRICAASCRSNDDCRDGYACDPQWHACTVPNAAAIRPKECAAPVGFGRDPTFGPATAVSNPILATREPSAVIADDGTLVAIALDDEKHLAS